MGNGFYWHLHHDKLFEWCFDFQERLDFIKANKDESEIDLRVKLFKPIKDKLPEELLEAGQKYDDALQKYYEAWQKCNEARQKYYEAWQKCNEAWQKCYDAGQKYYEVIKALHEEECPNCPWNDNTIFPEV